MTIRMAAYGDTLIEYRLVHAERRSLAISVLPDGVVDVVAPLGVDVVEVDRRVSRRARWILRQQRGFAEFRPRTPPRRYVGGETHRYLGRQYRLKIERSTKELVALRRNRLVVETSRPHDRQGVRQLVQAWMRARARVVLVQQFETIARTAHLIGVETPSVSIRSMARRWGSHTSSGRIILNAALIAARRDWIDYVVVHELCHVVEPLHSPAFFRLLCRLMPDWERRKAALEKALV